MPLKTNVGVSRKVSDNQYGSRGASVNLEVELDSTLVQQPERFLERVRQVFRLAQQSVDEELSRQNGGSDNGHAANGNGHANGHAATNGNGTANHANGNGHRRSSGRKSTASQARALRAIAERQNLDLAAELQTRFGVSDPEELSISEASQTIDALNAAVTNGR